MRRHHGGPSRVMPAEITRATALWDGSTGGVRALFPRNASTHLMAALAGIEFDRSGSALVADLA